MPQPVITPKVDCFSGAAAMAGLEEWMIHQGKAFTAHYENTATGLGLVTAIGLRTPDLVTHQQPGRMHLVMEAQADDESTFQIDEVPTIDNDAGSNLASYNRERDSDIVTNARRLLNIDPGGTGFIMSYQEVEFAAANYAAGTILLEKAIGAAGNLVYTTKKIVLADNTRYAILLTTLTANATVHGITLNWYELAPGDYAN